MFTNEHTVNTQLNTQLIKQAAIGKTGRYNKNFVFKPPEHHFDEKELVFALFELLQTKHLKIAKIIPLLLVLKNLLENDKENVEQKIFESRIQEILQSENVINVKKIINSLSYLKNKKNNLGEEFNYYLDWLQDRLLFVNTIQGSWYQNILNKLKKFRSDSELSIFDKIFRYFNAAVTGIGFGSFFLTWGPLALFSILAGCGVVVTPLGIVLGTLGFGAVAISVGGILFDKFIKNYAKEDKAITHQVEETEQQIIAIARKEALLSKQHFCLNYKNLCLLEKLHSYEPVKPETITDINDANIPAKKETTQLDLPWRVAMTFVGTFGSVWGFSSLVTSILGISLISSGFFLPLGLAVAASALVVASIVAYKSYTYECKSNASQSRLNRINDEVTDVQKRLGDEQAKISELVTEKEALKAQLIAEQPQNITQLKHDFQEIEQNNFPLVIDDFHQQKAIVDRSKYHPNGVTLFSRLGIIKTETEEEVSSLEAETAFAPSTM